MPLAAGKPRTSRVSLLMVFFAISAARGSGRPAGPEPSPPTVSVSTTRGDDISLSGRVTATYAPYVFAVGSGVERVVVVTHVPIGVMVGSDGDVAGQVRTFRGDQLESEFGVDLGPETNQLENRSCLVATVARVH